MPMIPIPRGPQQNTNVPDQPLQNLNQVGQVEGALADTAGKVSSFALGLMEKRKKAADNDYAFRTTVDDYQAIEQKANQLKLESPEDATGYAAKMQEFLAKRREENEKNATSEDGLRAYREKSSSIYKGAEVEATNFENQTRAKYYVKSTNDSANKLASTFLSNPDPLKAKAAQLMLENEIEQNAQTHFVDASHRANLKQEARDGISMSVFNGLDARERYADQVKLLKNTDEKSDLFLGMDAEKRGALLRRAENGLQTKHKEFDNQLRGRVADVMAGLNAGDSVSPAATNQLIKEIQISGLKPYEKAHFTDSLKISGVVAETKQGLLNQNINSWKSPDEIIPDRGDASNARVVNHAQAVLGREMITLRKEANADGAAYALRSSPALQAMSQQIKPGDPTDTQNFAIQMLARQEALGIQRPRVLTAGQAQTVAQSYVAQDPVEAARSALSLRQAYGRMAPKVFAEVAKDGNLPPDYMLVAYMPTPQSAATIVDNLKRSSDIREAYKTRFKTDEADFTRKVTTKLDPYLSAIDQNQTSGSLSLGNALTNQVKLEAMKQRSMSGSLSDGDAIDAALDSVVKTNFAVIKNPSGSSFLMPKVDGAGKALSEDTVSSYVKAHSRPAGFEALNVAVDPEYSGDKNAYYAQMSKTAYWTASKDNSELILAARVNGQVRALKDSSGAPIRKSFHEISNGADPLTMAEQTPLWRKLFKSNSAEAAPK